MEVQSGTTTGASQPSEISRIYAERRYTGRGNDCDLVLCSRRFQRSPFLHAEYSRQRSFSPRRWD
jgi:hypothetical protein